VTVHDINDHMAYTHGCGSVHFNLLRSGRIECASCGEQLESTVNYETKTYSDGTTASGPAPLPERSPTEKEEAEVLALAEDYGQWMWDAGYMDDPRGENLVDNAKIKRDEIAKALNSVLVSAYADGRRDEAEALAHRGYVLFGAGAYLLTLCKGDERGPELVAHLATEAEMVGRTVGDLGDVVADKEIPLERVAVRLQFASEAGLAALEQQLRMLREEHFSKA
jgi:hypothetical protein